MSTNFKPLQDPRAVINLSTTMCKVEEMKINILEAFSGSGLNRLKEILEHKKRGGIALDNRKIWFEDGIECEILNPNAQDWQKGKIRFKVTLEFCPDELNTNSTLDDLRGFNT